MSQQNKQHHNQHPNQAPRPQQQTQPTSPVVANTPNPPQPIAVIEKTPTNERIVISERKEDLKQVLTRLVSEVMEGKRQPETTRIALHDWYHSLSSDEQHAFKAGRIQADETMNWFKGVVEILAQELPSLYVA